MDIRIEHFAGDKPQFNVALASAPGKEPFLTVKGCRIVDGSKGPFVSWPATKNQSTGKYWNHVWASEAFAAAVLAKAQESQPRQAPRRAAAPDTGMDDIPF
jgi:DNA-binding cell septation regulator SpoVG